MSAYPSPAWEEFTSPRLPVLPYTERHRIAKRGPKLFYLQRKIQRIGTSLKERASLHEEDEVHQQPKI